MWTVTITHLTCFGDTNQYKDQPAATPMNGYFFKTRFSWACSLEVKTKPLIRLPFSVLQKTQIIQDHCPPVVSSAWVAVAVGRRRRPYCCTLTTILWLQAAAAGPQTPAHGEHGSRNTGTRRNGQEQHRTGNCFKEHSILKKFETKHTSCRWNMSG